MSELRPGTAVLAASALILSAAAAGEPLVITITGTRTAQPLERALSATTVITRADIERLQPPTLGDLLTATPGVQISSNGGRGKNTGVFLRGTETDQVLLLVDGVKLRSATAGIPAWQHIPLAQIERIEVVRGPHSALYGSEAIGGVVQIFTRRGEGTPRAHGAVGFGSHGTREAEAGVLGRSAGGTAYSASLAHTRTDGFDITEDGLEPDADGYDSTSGSLRLGHDFGGGHAVDLSLLRAEGSNEFDGGFLNEDDFVQQVAALTVSGRIRPDWDMRLRAAQSRDESENFLDGQARGFFDTRSDQLAWENELRLTPDSRLSFGLDYLDDRVSSTATFDEDARSNLAAFVGHAAGLGPHSLEWSLRHDDNEAFGRQTTGRAAWGYAFSPALRLSASYGTAFKAPSFNELFFPGFGNPDLDPEESRSAELGLDGTAGGIRWRASVYETRVENLIATVNTGEQDAFGFDIFRPVNVGEARIRGLELAASGRVAGWDVQASAQLMDPRDEDLDTLLRRRAERSLRLDLDRAVGPWNLGLSWVAESFRYEDAANTVRIPGYGLLHLRGGYQLQRDWRIGVAVNNALDHDYQTARGFRQPDLEALVSLEYRPH